MTFGPTSEPFGSTDIAGTGKITLGSLASPGDCVSLSRVEGTVVVVDDDLDEEEVAILVVRRVVDFFCVLWIIFGLFEVVGFLVNDCLEGENALVVTELWLLFTLKTSFPIPFTVSQLGTVRIIFFGVVVVEMGVVVGTGVVSGIEVLFSNLWTESLLFPFSVLFLKASVEFTSSRSTRVTLVDKELPGLEDITVLSVEEVTFVM